MERIFKDIFEKVVKENGDRIAVIQDDLFISYNELNNKTINISIKIGTLAEKNRENKFSILLFFDHGIDMIQGILGALKTNCIYVTIDVDYPLERIKFIARDSFAKLILTNNNYIEKANLIVENSNIDVINIDQLDFDMISYSNDYYINQANRISYILYTSGSTGFPKGVYQNFRNIMFYAYGYIENLKITNNDKLSLLASFSHDAYIPDLFGAFLSGATLCPYNVKYKDNFSNLEKFLSSVSVTIWHSVPTLFRIFTNEVINTEYIRSLRWVVLGGEQVIMHDIMKYKRYFKKARFGNLYGQTESTINSIWTFNSDSEIKRVIIGTPLNEISILIVDEDGNILEDIGVGEIVVSNPYRALGYWENIDLSQKVFTESDEFGLLYWTGDLGRKHSNGDIEFLGRMDQQVKIRGFRIELGEIESQLLSIEGIKETVVLAKEDQQEQKYLVAYYVSDVEFEVSELRNELSKSLPDYMIPAYFVRLDKIPLTSNGKIDRKSLPDPEIVVGEDYVAPRNEVEDKLVGIWSEVLGIDKEKISIDANFFELGGHSLKATILISKIHKAFDVKVALAEIFKTPKIIDLGQTIKNSKINKYASILPAVNKEYYALSSAQKRMYVLQQMDLSSTAYNMPQMLPIGEVTKEQLEFVVKKLISRHESFRTSFEVMNDEPMQKIWEEVAFEVECYEVSDPAEIDKKFKQFIRPFNLSEASLLRVGLIRTPDNNNYLLADMHHIISDGASMELLRKDFMALLNGEELEPLRLQYKDYSEWQNGEVQQDEMKRQEEYWLNQFNDEVPVLDLPYDYIRPVMQCFEGASVSFVVDEAKTAKIRDICKETNTTVSMVLLAVYNILLSKLSGQEDIIVGLPIAGRRHVDLEKIIGMFVNTLALRNYPRGELTFKEFLNAVKNSTLLAYENQDYQFEDLVNRVSLARDFSRNPIFDVVLVIQNTVKFEDNKDTGTYIEKNISANYDIVLECLEFSNKLTFNWIYCVKLFNSQSSTNFVNFYQKILNIVLENPECFINRILLVSQNKKANPKFNL